VQVGILKAGIGNDGHKVSALAVGTSGEPGDGFYTWAKDLGRLQDDSKEGRHQFWEQENKAVYETWKVDISG
jgi:hypothetical protein